MAQDAGALLRIKEVADALGLHHTGVRTQVAILEGAGVVESHADPPRGRGRPARCYVLVPDPGDREARAHRELIRLLVGLAYRTGIDPDEMGRFGEGQGWAAPTPGGGIGELRDAFERMGFAPREVPDTNPTDLILDRRPFVAPEREAS